MTVALSCDKNISQRSDSTYAINRTSWTTANVNSSTTALKRWTTKIKIVKNYLCNCNFMWCTKTRPHWEKKRQEKDIISKPGFDVSCLQMTVQGLQTPWAPLLADRSRSRLWFHLQHLQRILDFVKFLCSTFTQKKFWWLRSFFVERCASHVQVIYDGIKCLTLQSTHHPGADRLQVTEGGWLFHCQLYQASHLQRAQARAGISPWVSPSTQSPVVPASQGGHGVFPTHFHREFCFPPPPPVPYFMGSDLICLLPPVFDVHTLCVCLYLHLNICTSISELFFPTCSLVNTYCGFR